MTRSERWIADITFFEHEFVENAKTYTDSSKAVTKKLLTSLKEQIDKLSDFQIQLELGRAVVMADNGHTSMSLPQLKKIPLRFYRFSDGLHAVKTDAPSAHYLEAQVLEVNGMAVTELETTLFPYVSGTTAWKKFKTMGLITAPELLYELGLGSKDAIALKLVKEQDTLEVVLGAQKVKRDRSWYESWADLYPSENSDNAWRFLKTDMETLPLYLKNAEQGVHYTFEEETKIAYFQINSFWEKCADIKGKLREFHDVLATKQDYHVVLDLRFYTGGNYGVFTELATTVPKLISANQKIFLVLSDKTYSAGIVTAARIKHYAKDKLVVVGEAVGDRLKFWAESRLVTLPHSKIRIYDARKAHDWADNRRSLFKTHLANYLYGVAAKDLNLDQEIRLSFQEYMADRDPVLEWIVAQAKEGVN